VADSGPDARLNPTDRFHQALQLLEQAKRDASHREDDPWVRDLQGRILHHIDDAHRATQQAIADALRYRCFFLTTATTIKPLATLGDQCLP
jgi:hypothetical protein